MRLLLAIFLGIHSAFCFSAPDEELDQLRAQESRAYTARVLAERGNVLTGLKDGGSGSGFIARLTATEGLVFTNYHVIDIPNRYAKKFSLEFFSADDAPSERVEAELAFKSPVTDFAILRFDPRQLKRLGGQLKEAPIAKRAEALMYDYIGARVMTVGNPSGYRDIRTFGTISGRTQLEWQGQFIQIDAAINQGNSGGPLVHVRTGKVIGMNTLKDMSGDALGFALRIQDVLEEYDNWKNNPEYQKLRSVQAVFGTHSMTALTDGLGLGAVIEALPLGEDNFLERYDSLYYVKKAAPGTRLRQGDILLAVHGIPIGHHGHRIRKAIQACGSPPCDFFVIRDHVPMHVPVETTLIGDRLQEPDANGLVSFSGFVFAEVNEFVSFVKTNGESRVVIPEIIPGTWADNQFKRLRSGFINGIVVGGTRYPVKTIADLKAALTHLNQAKHQVVTISIHSPLYNRIDDNWFPVPDDVLSLPALAPSAEDVIVPVIDYADDVLINLEKVKKDYDFRGGYGRPASRNGLAGIMSQLHAMSCGMSVAITPSESPVSPANP